MVERDVQVDRFFALHAEQGSLDGILETASPVTKDLVEAAKSRIDTEIDSLARQPSVAAYLGEIAAPVLQSVQEVENLRRFVTLGVMTDNELEERKQSIFDQLEPGSEIQIAAQYVLGKQAVATEVQLQPAYSQETATTPEVVKPRITITQLDRAIQIGKDGKFILTSATRHARQRDYTVERLAILETLIKHCGEELNANELWNETFGDDRQFENGTMDQVRSWLHTLTYRRQPIVEHNGKRGPASAYGITRFTVELKKQEITTPKVPVSPETTESARHGLRPRLKLRSSRETVQQSASIFPLGIYESAVVANFLSINRGELEQLNIMPIDEEVVKEFEQHTTPLQHKIAITEHGSVQGLRLHALAKLRTFFSDEDLVLRAISEMSPKDHRSKLFEYLFSIEGPDRWKLFENLANAERGHAVTARIGRHEPTYIVDTERTTVLAPGTMGELILRGNGDTKHSEHASELPKTARPLGLKLPSMPVEVVPPGQPREEAADQPIQTQTETASSSELLDFEKNLRREIGGWLNEIERNSLLGRKRPAVESIWPWATRKFCRNASENGHLSSGRSFTLTDLLMLRAIHEFPQAISVAHSRTKPNAQQLKKVIRSCVQSYESNNS